MQSNYHWWGNGLCDQEYNSKVFGFDGGDCCGNYVKQGFCINCDCLDPQYKNDGYSNYQDVLKGWQ